MNRRHLLLCALSAPFSSQALAATATQDRADWSALFGDRRGQGTVVVVDGRRGREASFVPRPAAGRAAANAGLDLQDSPTACSRSTRACCGTSSRRSPGTGAKRSVPAWNADQDLRTAMRNSTVWVYERFAAQLGTQRETAYLERIGYGNAAERHAAVLGRG